MAEYYGLYLPVLFLLESRIKYCYTKLIIPRPFGCFFPNFTYLHSASVRKGILLCE